MKKIDFKGCRSMEDIEARIKDALKYETVVADAEAAERLFWEGGAIGSVCHNEIQSDIVSVWYEDMRYEECYRARVEEHYTDPGSEDYVYSYDVYAL